MKRILCMLLAAIICALGAALAQAEYYTGKTDIYYHALENCGGVRGRVPLTETAAAEFKKYACPVCIQAEDDGADVRAAARGGTIVVRFSDEWVYNHELTGVFGFMPADVSEGEAGWMQLGKYLHGARYADFLADYAADGKAEGRCCVPWVLGTGEPDGEDWKDLKMSARHIGASWYIVIRPESKFEKTWRMFWRVSSYELTLTDEGLTSLFDLQTLEENRLMQLERFKGASPEYQRDGDLQISVFDALGGHIAVLSQQNGEALADARLIIDGRDTGARLSGYADGANAVYCCALTEGELVQLRDGAAAAIVA